MMSSSILSGSRLVCLETLGNLILDELKLIRIEMKEEVRNLGKEIKQLYVDQKKHTGLHKPEKNDKSGSHSFIKEEGMLDSSGIVFREKATTSQEHTMKLKKKSRSNERTSFKSLNHVVDILKNQALIVKKEVTNIASVEKLDDPVKDFQAINNEIVSDETKLFETVDHIKDTAVSSDITDSKLLPSEAQSSYNSSVNNVDVNLSVNTSTSFKDAEVSELLKSDLNDGNIPAFSFNGLETTSTSWTSCVKLKSEAGNSFDQQPSQLETSNESPNFLCNYCMKPFRHYSAYKSHLRTHTGEKPFKCHLCDKLFSQKCYLKRHVLWHSNEKPFVCEVCNKGFVDKGNLKAHLRTHTGEKPFLCNICNKRFSQKSGLSQHILLHKNIKPHICFVCDKRFLQKSGLTAHLSTHTGVKPFQCTVCDKAFALKNYLTQHMRSHSKEKPFACHMCDKAFGQKAYLNAHLARHKNNSLFECDVCKKSFKKQICLVAHKQIHNM